MSCGVGLKKWIAVLLWLTIIGCDHYFVVDSNTTSTDTTNANDSTSTPTDTAVNEVDIPFETGFEDGLLETIEGDGTVTINTDSNWLVSGERSAAFSLSSSQLRAALFVPFAPIESGDIYFRANYFLANPPAAGLINIMELVDDQQANVHDINITSELQMNLFSFIDDTAAESPDNTVATGQWFCVVAHYQLSDTNGQVDIYINDTLTLSTPTTIDSLPDGGITGMRFGLVHGDDSVGTITIYIDDVALSTAPLGC